ncbi:uncharacterized protein LOC102808471 [Saccoglossus kowalevskii]
MNIRQFVFLLVFVVLTTLLLNAYFELRGNTEPVKDPAIQSKETLTKARVISSNPTHDQPPIPKVDVNDENPQGIRERKQLPMMQNQTLISKKEEKANNSQIIRESEQSSSKTTGSTLNLDHRYMIPVHLDGNGPNCQYQALRAGMKYALIKNLTLSEIFFFNHWTAGNEFSGRKFVNETFDMKIIKELVDLISVEEFRHLCNGAVGVVIFPGRCLNLNETYKRVSVEFTAEYGIKLPTMDGKLTHIGNELAIVEPSQNSQCIGLFEPDRGCQVRVSNEITRTVDKHLTRTKEIRTLADQITKHICNGGPYIAMHFRNKSGEHFAHPGSRYHTSTLAKMRQEVAVLCEDVKKFMLLKKIECIYVSFPNFSSAISKMLKDANVDNIITRDDITSTSYPIKIRDKIRLDNYHVSLLETEICVRSTVFFSSTESALTRMVTYARDTKPDNNLTIPLYEIKNWV